MASPKAKANNIRAEKKTILGQEGMLTTHMKSKTARKKRNTRISALMNKITFVCAQKNKTQIYSQVTT